MTSSIVASYNDAISVSFRSDAWFNATQVASSFGKRPVDWLRTDETKEYIKAIVQICTVDENQLVSKKAGNPEHGGGTWMHPKLGIPFARWLDARFGVWCDMQIEKILHSQNGLKLLESPTLTASDQQTLSEIVDHRARECANIGKAKAEIWSRIHRKFRIARYQQLPREQLSAAITYVMQMDLKTEAAPAMPVPEKAAYRDIADYTYAREQMSSLYDWSRRALPPRVQDEVYDVLKELDRSLVRGWTEIDESIICLIKAMGMLRRWKRAH